MSAGAAATMVGAALAVSRRDVESPPPPVPDPPAVVETTGSLPVVVLETPTTSLPMAEVVEDARVLVTTPPPVEIELKEQPSYGWGVATEEIAQAGHLIQEKFGVTTIYGRGSRGNVSDHPTGHALDFMVSKVVGDLLAAYVIENHVALGVKYVIWDDRYWDPSQSGWTPYTQPSGATDDTSAHRDHVHVSFL